MSFHELVVDCANPNLTYSLVDMPIGNYAITITAKFIDGRYDDNIGQIVVTATWIPV